MKTIAPTDSRYLPLVQEKCCCVPASISMVMYRHGIPLIPQEVLGWHLGLTTKKQFKNLFWKVRLSKTHCGTQISKKKFEPNKVFKKLKIPLKFRHHKTKQMNLAEFTAFMVKAVKQGRDILLCFDHPTLNGEKKPGWGHVCVLDRVYPNKGSVRMMDPQPGQPKWRAVKIKDLKKAIDVHTDVAGFWELTKV